MAREPVPAMPNVSLNDGAISGSLAAGDGHAMPRKRKEQLQGRQRGRLLFAALLCGPMAGAVVLEIIAAIALLMNPSGGVSGAAIVQILMSGGLMGAVIGWPTMLLFGLPAHVFLYRRKSHRISAYVLAGTLAGFAASAALLGLGFWAGMFGPSSMFGPEVGYLAVVVLIGAVTASSLFWLIRRPDRDVAKPDAVAAAFE